MNTEAIRQQVKEATQEAFSQWMLTGKVSMVMWNPETGDRTHLD